MPPQNSLLKVYLEVRPALLRFVAARFRDASIAEDIIQEIYLKIERMPAVPDISNPEAYLFKMANNLALDIRKSMSRRRTRDQAWGDAQSETIGDEPVLDQPRADQVIEQKQEINQLKELIDELPPQCKRVFIAHKIQELSHREIALKFNISKSAVEKHIARAMKHLIMRLRKNE